MDPPIESTAPKASRWRFAPGWQTLAEDTELLARLERLDETGISGAELVTELGDRRVFRLEAGGRGIFAKLFRPTGLARRIWYSFAPGRSLLEWRHGTEAARRAIPVPAPVAYGAAWSRGLLAWEVYLGEELAGWRPLAAIGDEARDLGAIGAARRENLEGALIDLLSAAFSRGLDHRDLHPGNVLISPDERRAVVIDLDLARFGPPLRRAALVRCLADLDRYFLPRLEPMARLRFLARLRSRLAPLAGLDLRRLAAAVEARSAGSVRANWRRRFRERFFKPKYYRPMALGPLRGWRVADFDPLPFEPLLAGLATTQSSGFGMEDHRHPDIEGGVRLMLEERTGGSSPAEERFRMSYFLELRRIDHLRALAFLDGPRGSVYIGEGPGDLTPFEASSGTKTTQLTRLDRDRRTLALARRFDCFAALGRLLARMHRLGLAGWVPCRGSILMRAGERSASLVLADAIGLADRGRLRTSEHHADLARFLEVCRRAYGMSRTEALRFLAAYDPWSDPGELARRVGKSTVDPGEPAEA